MWTQEDSSTWLQYVSKEPSSRLDVITLQEALDQRLMHRQAREMGICPVREDLYSQCFGACSCDCVTTALLLKTVLGIVRRRCASLVVSA